MSVLVKDPEATELFGCDFASRLIANRIPAAMVTGHQVLPVPAADGSILTVETSSRSGGEVTARISGGVAGRTYDVIFNLLFGTSDLPGKPQVLKWTRQIRVARQ